MSQRTPVPQLKARQIAQQPLVKYEPSAMHDGMIFNAYLAMVAEGTVFNVIPDGSISGLMLAIHPPTTTYFKVDEKGAIWFLAWFEPNQILGRMMALWIAKERRQTKAAVSSISEALKVGLSSYGELIAVTTQQRVIDGCLEYGYDVVGKIEPTDEREDAKWILHLRRKTVEETH